MDRAGCAPCRDGRLGFDWGSALDFGTEVLQTVQGGSSSPSVGSQLPAAKPSGGGVTRSGCPQWPVSLVALTLSQMSPSELAALQTSLTNSHVAGASVNDPASVQYWCAGGGDCNTSSQHPDVVAFNARCVQNLSFPSNTPSDYGTQLTTTTSTAPVTGQSFTDWLKQTLENAVHAGANAAVTSATTATYAQLTPAQQAALQKQAAQSWIQKNALLVGVGAIAVVLALRRRR